MTDDDIQKAARTARTAIADLVEAAMDEKRVDGQGVHYWSEVAKHSLARNDTLISQLKEKEKIAADLETQLDVAVSGRSYSRLQETIKEQDEHIKKIEDLTRRVQEDRKRLQEIAAEQEQRITSLQNEILNQVYTGTQDGLEAELERVHAAAAEWERKFNGLQANYKEDEEVYSRTREENQKLVQALREKDAQIAEMAKAITPVDGKSADNAERRRHRAQMNSLVRLTWNALEPTSRLTRRRDREGNLWAVEFRNHTFNSAWNSNDHHFMGSSEYAWDDGSDATGEAHIEYRIVKADQKA